MYRSQTVIRFYLLKFVIAVLCLIVVRGVLAFETVVVTATRTAQTADQILSPVTVISSEDIQNSQARDLGELLSLVPGIEFTRNGGYGKNTSIFMRGTNSGHVLTLIDGVKLYSATVGTTAFQFLPLDQIDRIEIVRGPRSNLYGSEAVGGVIQIFTKDGSGKTSSHAEVGYGSYNTLTAGAGSTGFSGDSSYSLNVGYSNTDGIDSQTGAQPDKDGYDNTSLTARWTRRLDAENDLNVSLLHASGNTAFDNAWAGESVVHDSDYTQQILNFRLDHADEEGWQGKLQFGRSLDDSETFADGVSDGKFDTTRFQLNGQLDWPVSGQHLLTVGSDYSKDSVDSSVIYDIDERSNLGVFLQWQGIHGAQNFVAGARIDNNEQFGTHTTGNVDYALDLTSGYRLNMGYGTAFKSPSFNDLYYPGFGTPTLDVETSSSFEIGLSGDSYRGHWSIRGFQTSIEDLIGYDPVTWASVNVDKARINGFEFEWDGLVKAGLLRNWEMEASLTLSDPIDRSTNNQLPRRAKEVIQLNLDRQHQTSRYGLNLQYHGSRYDDKANSSRLDSYALIHGYFGYELNRSWTIRTEVNNLLGKVYATAKNYNEPGRVWFLRLQYQAEK